MGLKTKTDQQVKSLNVTSDRAGGSENWLDHLLSHFVPQ